MICLLISGVDFEVPAVQFFGGVVMEVEEKSPTDQLNKTHESFTNLKISQKEFGIFLPNDTPT